MSSPVDTDPLKEFLSLAVAYIIDTRVKMNRPPYLATKSNIKNVVTQSLDKALAEMTEEGVFTERRTLNEPAYEFTPPRQTNI